MTPDTAALVRQMREALKALRSFDVEPECAINRHLFSIMDESISAADKWLAQPPTNQCGETCERAALCATCARGLEQSRVPLTDELLLDAAGETLYLHHRNEVDRLVRACAEKPMPTKTRKQR